MHLEWPVYPVVHWELCLPWSPSTSTGTNWSLHMFSIFQIFNGLGYRVSVSKTSSVVYVPNLLPIFYFQFWHQLSLTWVASLSTSNTVPGLTLSHFALLRMAASAASLMKPPPPIPTLPGLGLSVAQGCSGLEQPCFALEHLWMCLQSCVTLAWTVRPWKQPWITALSMAHPEPGSVRRV